MNNRSIEDLLAKYLTGSISDRERSLLSEMLNEPRYQKQLEEIIGKELEERAFEGKEYPQILASIQDNLTRKINAEKKPAKAISFFIQRTAVAAVFVLLAGAGAYWLYTSKNNANPGVVLKTDKDQDPLVPGGNRAILKLSDGTEIFLDKAGAGTIAQQGKAKIVKVSEGLLSYGLINDRSTEVLYNTITTPKGGLYQLMLADGSKVWLNAASSLRFPAFFNGKERVVELTGEGYFEVAKNAAPFHVKVNDVGIQVLGTHFNVNGYEDEPSLNITLLEGSVKLTNGLQNSFLKPGQQASVTKTGEMPVVTQVDAERMVAWTNGIFDFKNTDIKTILREAARWYNVQFKYDEVLSTTFSGQISRNVNVSQLLKILELTGKVHFDINGRTIIVKP